MLLSEYDQSAVRLADAAMQKVVQFHYSREFSPRKQLPPKGMLFHKHGESAPSLLNADLDPAVGHILQTAMRFCLKAQTS